MTAPIAPGIGAGSTETRVKALDVLAWPRVGVRSPESPDRRWENRPRYDGKAVGTVLARYYDPATAQFLTVDPRVATTLSPYGYVAGNPLNASDPLGLCSWNPFSADSCEIAEPAKAATSVWNATGGQVVNNIQNFSTSSHTLGVCMSVSGNLIAGGGFGEVCGVVRFLGTTPVGFATTETLGAGAGPGLGFSGLVEAQGTNAPNLKSLGGPFAYVGGSAGGGPAGGGSFAEGVGSCGPFSVVTGGVGVGLGAGAQVGGDYTWEQTWFGS